MPIGTTAAAVPTARSAAFTRLKSAMRPMSGAPMKPLPKRASASRAFASWTCRWPAMLPVTLRVMADSMLSRVEVPTTTRNVPKAIRSPTAAFFVLWLKRFNQAIWARTRARARRRTSGHLGDGRELVIAVDDAVGDVHDAPRVGHDVLVVGREDERRLVARVQLLHEGDDRLAGDRVE